MTVPLTREQLANRQFLEMRCKVLDLAAAFDRLDRANGLSVLEESRFANLRRAIETLLESDSARAERVQMIFSRPYHADWRGA